MAIVPSFSSTLIDCPWQQRQKDTLFNLTLDLAKNLMTSSLPHLPDLERLSPIVVRILGDNPSKYTLQGTNTYIIGNGRSRILIDTAQGFPSWRDRLSSFLKSENATISIALITHWHHDHIGGLTDLRSLCPDATIYKYRLADDDDGSEQLSALEDGQDFRVEGATLRALHCPGHTSDHTAFVLEEEEAMFTGDNVLGHGTAVFEDLATYLASLARMRDYARRGRRAYPGHGAVIVDGKTKIEEYLQHRKDREGEVLRVLEASSCDGKTAMEVVKVVYAAYPESLHEPAREGVLQILRKLEGEGKVTEDGSRGKWMAETVPKPVL